MAKPIAVIMGASPVRSKFSNKSIRAHLKAGYDVFGVHPTVEEVEGVACFASIAEVPGDIGRVSFYLPPAIGLTVLDSVAARNPKEVWINPGAGSVELFERGEALGLNMIDGCSIVDLGLSPSQFPG